MAVRPIDAEKYMELLKEQYLHHKSLGNSQAEKAWQGAMQLLYDMPTLTPPNEPLTLEQLRGKVGQPVVIKYSYGGPHTVAIVDVRYVPHLGADKIRLVFPDGYITVNERDYGTYFTTYAYPPANIGLLAREEAAEARAEKAERERDAAVSDLEFIMAYNKDTCQFCKNGQCYIRGGTKPCLPKWRGQKED